LGTGASRATEPGCVNRCGGRLVLDVAWWHVGACPIEESGPFRTFVTGGHWLVVAGGRTIAAAKTRPHSLADAGAPGAHQL
jgi:hypothetical protein